VDTLWKPAMREIGDCIAITMTNFSHYSPTFYYKAKRCVWRYMLVVGSGAVSHISFLTWVH